MAKIFRFDNGFIGTFLDYVTKFGTSKELNFRNALKRVSRSRFNSMGAFEQRQYEEKRRFAKPEYRVYTDGRTYIEVPKSVFEQAELPVSNPDILLPVFIRPERTEIASNYVSKKKSEDKYWDDAMRQFTKDAEKQAINLAMGAGYIHTGNYHLPRNVEVKVNHTNVTVTIHVQGESHTLVFSYSSSVGNSGVEYCRLVTVELVDAEGTSSKRILNYQSQCSPFDYLLEKLQPMDGTLSAHFIYVE